MALLKPEHEVQRCHFIAPFRVQPNAASLNWTFRQHDVNIYVNKMPHVLFVWNDEIIAYLARHGVSREEFEEVVLDSREIETSRSSRRPIVFGETSKGKYLACVFEYIDRKVVA